MEFTENKEQGVQPYKYNGKELDTKHGLNMYDYSARYYEPSIGRFSMVDPMAEKYYSISPYTYVMNNPLKYIDPDGRSAMYPDGGWVGLGKQLVPNQQSTPIQKLAVDTEVNTAIPAAIGTSLNYSKTVGTVEFNLSLSISYILKGPDAGSFYPYLTGGVGGATPNKGSLSLGLDFTYFDGEPSNFDRFTMEGISDYVSLSVDGGLPISAGVSNSSANTKEGRVSTTSLRVGEGGSGVSLSAGKQYSLQLRDGNYQQGTLKSLGSKTPKQEVKIDYSNQPIPYKKDEKANSNYWTNF